MANYGTVAPSRFAKDDKDRDLDEAIVMVISENHQVYYQGLQIKFPTAYGGREYNRTITAKEFTLTDPRTGEVVFSFPCPCMPYASTDARSPPTGSAESTCLIPPRTSYASSRNTKEPTPAGSSKPLKSSTGANQVRPAPSGNCVRSHEIRCPRSHDIQCPRDATRLHTGSLHKRYSKPRLNGIDGGETGEAKLMEGELVIDRRRCPTSTGFHTTVKWPLAGGSAPGLGRPHHPQLRKRKIPANYLTPDTRALLTDRQHLKVANLWARDVDNVGLQVTCGVSGHHHRRLPHPKRKAGKKLMKNVIDTTRKGLPAGYKELVRRHAMAQTQTGAGVLRPPQGTAARLGDT